MLIRGDGPRVHHPIAAVGSLAQTDDLAVHAQGVAGKHGREETAIRITEVGDSIQGNVRNSLAESNVEHQPRIQRLARKTGSGRHRLSAADRVTRSRQRNIEAAISLTEGAGRGMRDVHTDAEVLKEVAASGLCAGHAHGISGLRIVALVNTTARCE